MLYIIRITRPNVLRHARLNDIVGQGRANPDELGGDNNTTIFTPPGFSPEDNVFVISYCVPRIFWSLMARDDNPFCFGGRVKRKYSTTMNKALTLNNFVTLK